MAKKTKKPAAKTPPKPKPKSSKKPSPPRNKRQGVTVAPPDVPPDDPNHVPAVPLSDNERAFIEEYLIDRNSTQAYRRVFPNASYESARRHGSDIRLRPHVSRELDAALRAQRLRTRVSADSIISEMARVAFSDVLDLYDPNTQQLRSPRHIPYETRRAIMSVRVSRQRVTQRTNNTSQTTISDTIMEYKFHPKMDALGRLARHLGLDTEITPLEALLRMLPPDVSNMVRASLTTPTTAERTRPPARTNTLPPKPPNP